MEAITRSFKKFIPAILLMGLLSVTTSISAQEEELTDVQKLAQRTENLEAAVAKLNNLKVSGYIQGQWQWIEATGAKNSFGAGDFTADSKNRFGVRRGRVKFSYSNTYGQAVIQLDATEKGVGIKDAYLVLMDPNLNFVSLTGGVFNRPFGNEIAYSSSLRESPERARITQSLFPGERDLGAKITFQGAKGTYWNSFVLEGGFFAGNGVAVETDSKKDFIGRAAYMNTTSDFFNYAFGASYYNGGVVQPTSKVYTMKDGQFSLSDESANKGKIAKREYFGFDTQLLLNSMIGTTNLRAEYIWGQQPGTLNDNTSPKAARVDDTYIRNFSGYYVYLVQDIGFSRFSVVAKYDFYDPNTEVKGDEVDITKGLSAKDADLSYTTFGFGALYRANANIRIMAYYDIVKNETSSNTVSYKSDLKDNLFTLRLQYKF